MTQPATLLIVDDCPEDRETYRRYLQDDACQSYTIQMAESAEEGLEKLQTQAYDLVLLDLRLPDMDGLEFLDRLTLYPAAPPVVMLTAYGDEATAVRAMKQGAQDYLTKHHLRPDILQRSVRYGIEQFELRRQLERTRERQRLIATMALRIRQSLDLEQTLDTAVTEVRELLRCDRVFLHRFHPNGNGVITAESIAPGCGDPPEPSVAGLLPSQPDPLLPGAPRGGDSLAVETDVAVLAPPSIETASLSVPIVVGDDPEAQTWGILVVHHWSSARRWLADEVDTLNELSVQLAIAIQQAELFTQTQAALVREKELSAFKSKIITTVSHEYRTPLTSILAAASLLNKKGKHLPQTKQHKFLELIETKAWHMNKLVDDMLVVNKFELGQAKFQPFPVNLETFFNTLIEDQQSSDPIQHGIHLQQVGNIDDFWGDQGLLRQTFVNLLSNAIKYSPTGGDIHICITGQSDQVIIDIQDQGIGIPAQEQAHLFQSFRRGSNVDTIPGSGLGLMIAKTSAELHGGQIRVASTEGKGTTVTVCLPKRSNLVAFKVPDSLKV